MPLTLNHVPWLFFQGGLYPAETFVLYEPGATFDKKYNSHFKPYIFLVPNNIAQVGSYCN